MIDEMVVENALSREGMRVLHVMSSEPVAEGWLDVVPDVCKEEAKVERSEDRIHLHHLKATWAAREVVPWVFLENPFPLVRRMVLWAVDGKVSAAIKDAAVCYALGLGVDPEFALLREIPAQAEEGYEVGGVMLIQADWVPAGFVALVCGGDLRGQVPKFERVVPAVLLTGKQEKLSF